MKPELPQKIWPGMNCEVLKTPRGVIVSGQAAEVWRHPWWIDLDYAVREEPEPGGALGEWRATVWPGFVNGRDSFISMPKDWPEDGDEARDVALTDEVQPYLVLDGWRNPVQPSGAENGVLKAGEGYPSFFAALGVRPPATGGDPLSLRSQAPMDETRTREIRAMDVVLTIPRIGSRLDFRTSDPSIEAQTQFFQTVYLNDYFLRVGGRALLTAQSKHREAQAQTLQGLFGLLLSAGDDEFDARRMATVWMVSPPDAGENAVPDQTWEPYVQHFLFWNVNHAASVVPKPSGSSRLTLDVPLAGGVAQPLINQLLARVNDMQAEVEEFLRESVPAGHVWTP